jgi:perosamine synthetase
MVHRPISDTCPYPRFEEEAAAVAALLGRSLSGTSEPVAAYEAALARFFGARHAVAVSSGSAAVMAAAAALALAPGDQVVLTPTCPLCTVYPLMSMGVQPVFADTQADNFSLDLEDLERAIGPRTRAIIDIPMWGYPTPARALRAVADRHRLPLLLDLAHGHGVKADGRPLWTMGDIATFSTHSSKILSTGEGGFILTDNEALAAGARRFSRFGDLDGIHVGLNLKLGGLMAGLGQLRLAFFDESLRVRRANARRVLTGLRNPLVRELPLAPGGEPNYFTLLLQVSEPSNRPFIAHLARWGIGSDIEKYGCRPLYEFPLLSAYRRNCANAKRLLGTITTIPVHPGLSSADLEHIVRAINAYQSQGG